jgi:hypothetical protein
MAYPMMILRRTHLAEMPRPDTPNLSPDGICKDDICELPGASPTTPLRAPVLPDLGLHGACWRLMRSWPVVALNGSPS